MERDLLSGGLAGEQIAGVLRGEIHDDGSELQFSPDPEPEDHSELVRGNSGTFQVQPESATEGDAFREVEKLRGHDALLLPGHRRSGGETWSCALSIAAKPQEGHGAAGRVFGMCAVRLASRI